jgi:hypothetical protein
VPSIIAVVMKIVSAVYSAESTTCAANILHINHHPLRVDYSMTSAAGDRRQMAALLNAAPGTIGRCHWSGYKERINYTQSQWTPRALCLWYAIYIYAAVGIARQSYCTGTVAGRGPMLGYIYACYGVKRYATICSFQPPYTLVYLDVMQSAHVARNVVLLTTVRVGRRGLLTPLCCLLITSRSVACCCIFLVVVRTVPISTGGQAAHCSPVL